MTLDPALEQTSISALFLLRAYRACQFLGARRPVLLKALELDESQLRDPLKYFDPSKMSVLIEATRIEISTRNLVSKIAEKMVPMGFSDPGFLAMFEPSLGAVLEKAIRAQRLGMNEPIFRLQCNRLGDYVIWEDAACQSEKIIRLGFAIIFESLRSLSEDILHHVRKFSFSHAKPKHWNDEFLKFGDDTQIAISFDQPHNRIEFRREFFGLPNPKHDSPITEASQKQRSEARWQNKPHAQSCYNYLIYLLDKPGPNLDSAAETFSMAERTLRRRLVAEGTSFREILELARRDICQLYFLEGKRQLSDISTLLGYSELSAFTRAYTGWYGHPPSKDASSFAKLAA